MHQQQQPDFNDFYEKVVLPIQKGRKSPNHPFPIIAFKQDLKSKEGWKYLILRENCKDLFSFLMSEYDFVFSEKVAVEARKKVRRLVIDYRVPYVSEIKKELQKLKNNGKPA